MSSLHQMHDFLTAFKEGREEGYTYFFNSCYKPLYFFASRYLTDLHAAEDIITDSFIKLWDKREIFESEAGIKSYLYKSVYNGCLRFIENRVRKERVYKVYKVSNDGIENSYAENMIRAETIHLLHTAIGKLPAQCRTVFTKLYVEGKSVAETAAEMSLAVSTVKNQKARGIKLLRPKLQQ